MRLLNPICLFSSVVNYLRGVLRFGIPIDGHSYTENARWSDCEVHISRCERCGKFDVGWQRTSRSRYAPYADERLTEKEIELRTQQQAANDQ